MAGAIAGLMISPLPNFDLEENIIGMLMTPPEILSSLDDLNSPELAILAVLLPQVHTVGTILLVVPHMIVVAIAIVVAFIASTHRYGSNQACSDAKRGQNQKTAHIVNLLPDGKARRWPFDFHGRESLREWPTRQGRDLIRSDDLARSWLGPMRVQAESQALQQHAKRQLAGWTPECFRTSV
jgi:hypothetical protein